MPNQPNHFFAGSQHTNCSACTQWYVWRGCGQQVTYIHHGRECHGYLWAGFVQGWNDHIKNIFNDFEVWIYLGFNGTKPPRMTAAHIICSLNCVCLLNIKLGWDPRAYECIFCRVTLAFRKNGAFAFWNLPLTSSSVCFSSVRLILSLALLTVTAEPEADLDQGGANIVPKLFAVACISLTKWACPVGVSITGITSIQFCGKHWQAMFSLQL